MAPSLRRAPLRGAAAQCIARRLVAVSRMRSASGSKKISCSSSSTLTKVNISALSSVSLRATPTPDIPAPAPIAPPIAAPAPAPTNNLFRQFMQAYIEDPRPPILAQAPALVESKEQPLKARFPTCILENSI